MQGLVLKVSYQGAPLYGGSTKEVGAYGAQGPRDFESYLGFSVGTRKWNPKPLAA